MAISCLAFAQGRSPFQTTAPTSSIPLNVGETKNVSIQIEVPEGHFIYADKTKLEFHHLDGLKVESIEYPSRHRRIDPFFKKETDVFDEVVSIRKRRDIIWCT